MGTLIDDLGLTIGPVAKDGTAEPAGRDTVYYPPSPAPKDDSVLRKRDEILKGRMAQEAILRKRDELLRQRMAAEQEALLARRDALLAQQMAMAPDTSGMMQDYLSRTSRDQPNYDQLAQTATQLGHPAGRDDIRDADVPYQREQLRRTDEMTSREAGLPTAQAMAMTDRLAQFLRGAHQAQAAGMGAQTRPTAPADPDVQAAAAALLQPAANYAMTAPQEYVPPHLQAMRAAREAVNRAMLTTLPRPVATGIQEGMGLPAIGNALGAASLRNNE